MALLNCHECGKQVSTEAKSCPSCGAKVRAPKKHKTTSKLPWWLLGIVVVGTAVLTGGQREENEAIKKAEAARAAAMTPEQIAQDAAQKKKQLAQEKAKKDKENLILTLAAQGAKVLKQSSKDPDTFEFKSIWTYPTGAVCYEFRAKNSFNAMLAGQAVLADGKVLVHEQQPSAFVKAWNRDCTKEGGSDVTSFIARFVAS